MDERGEASLASLAVRARSSAWAWFVLPQRAMSSAATRIWKDSPTRRIETVPPNSLRLRGDRRRRPRCCGKPSTHQPTRASMVSPRQAGVFPVAHILLLGEQSDPAKSTGYLCPAKCCPSLASKGSLDPSYHHIPNRCVIQKFAQT